MRNSRQITVLRSLFQTLHPILESGLAPARRLLTGSQQQALENQATSESAEPPPAAQPNRAIPAKGSHATPIPPATTPTTATATVNAQQSTGSAPAKPTQPRTAKRKPVQVAIDRTLTDEHLVTELDNISRQISKHGHTAYTATSRRASPQRGQRHYSRDTLLALLEEAKVRIQVLETELELARGFDETIPMLTEEWRDDESEQQI